MSHSPGPPPPTLLRLAALEATSVLCRPSREEQYIEEVVVPLRRLLGDPSASAVGTAVTSRASDASGSPLDRLPDSESVSANLEYDRDDVLANVVDLQPAEAQAVMLDACLRNGWLSGPRLRAFMTSHLKTLHLDNIRWNSSYAVIAELGSRSPAIEDISFAHTNFPDRAIRAALGGVTSLRKLSLHDCPQVTDDTLHAALVSSLFLEHLDIGKCERLSDEGVLSIPLFCKRLQSLDACACHITDESLKGLNSGSALTSLNLTGCNDVELLPFNTASLTHLSAGGLTTVPPEMWTIALTPMLSSAVVLEIPECAVDATVLLSITGALTAPSLPLEKLDLCWCEELNDAAVTSLLRKCHALTSLSLRKLPVSNATAACIAQFCPRLVQLDLGRTDGINDDGIIPVVKSCTSLEKLDISWCDGVTLSGLEVILASLPSLTWLSLEGCKGIGDSSSLVHCVQHGRYSTGLRYLDLSWLNAASSAVVEEIIRCCCTQAVVVDYYGDKYDLRTAGNVFEMLRQAGETCVGPPSPSSTSSSPVPTPSDD